MKAVFEKLIAEIQADRSAVLAVIVQENGSAPRGKGACMLIGESGLLAGSVGGGAVEFLVEKQAEELLDKGGFLIKKYALRAGDKEDIGMVCGGDVTVLFHCFDASAAEIHSLILNMAGFLQESKEGYLILSAAGVPPVLSENIPDTVGSEDAVLPLYSHERAILFGGGHIARALCPLLKSVGFRVTVMDCREEFASSARFPDAEAVLCGDYLQLSSLLDITEEDYIVIMTNGHSFDAEVEEQILRRKTAYVGVIGSRKKTAAVNERLRAAGISEEALASVHTPIGMQIKAVTPEEIAVSIAGEMILCRAVRREQTGASAPKGCPMH